MNRGFGSDNHSGVHPSLLAAINNCNGEHEPSYGTDQWSELAETAFRQQFGPQTQVYFVFNGTAANVTALRALVKPYQAVICSDVSHLHQDECGAPEYLTGAKVLTVPSLNGKMILSELEKLIVRRGDQHHSQAAVLSITQPTELGTVYSVEELKTLIAFAKSKNLYVHIDGARLANAAYHLQLDLKQMTTDLGVDVVSMGGTKNGFMMGEAVIFCNPQLARDFKYIRKQSLQLPSKSRFIAAQFVAYLNNNLWQQIAQHSCQMAQLLFAEVQNIPGVQVRTEPQSNAVFAKIPQEWVKPARQKFFFYVWDEHQFECRWMTSWDTQKQDIYEFAKLLKELSREIPSRSLS